MICERRIRMTSNFFQWDREFLTGVDSIDEQHFSLIEIINNILKLCFQSQSIETKKITAILMQLENYTVDHFKSEEKIMMNSNVDPRHAKEHIHAHREFVKMIKIQFSDVNALTNVDELSESVEFLIRWLAYHILNMDKNMVKQMNMIQSDKISPLEAYDKIESSNKDTSEPLLRALKALFYIVSEKNKELERKNDELEEKVLLRTQELEEVNAKLEQISLTDELTKLPNRRYALQEIQRLIHIRDRYTTTFSVLFIDLDSFKPVNDTFGHDVGDQVLIWVANFLKNSIRKTDISCRLGGDEFVIICNNTGQNHAEKLAGKLSQNVKKKLPEDLSGFWKPSLSIGVSEATESVQSASDILSLADEAMYKVKNSIYL